MPAEPKRANSRVARRLSNKRGLPVSSSEAPHPRFSSGCNAMVKAFVLSTAVILVGLTTSAWARDKNKPPATYTIRTPGKPDFTPLNWLAGEWSGTFSGKNSPSGKIGLTASYDLDNTYFVLREDVVFAATKTAPATTEMWMGIISARPGEPGYIMYMYSSTGFVTRYNVSVESQGSAIRFAPEGGELVPSGWLFRRALERADEGLLDETVEVAPPGKNFFAYYTARLTKSHPPATSGKPATKPPSQAPAPSSPSDTQPTSPAGPAGSEPEKR